MRTMPGVRDALSIERFEAYRVQPSDGDAACVRRYVWNVALCEALYPCLHYLEIALRNGIHGAATDAFGTAFWFDDPDIIGDRRTRRIIANAKQDLRRARKPLDAGRVVAELRFGFWRHLFYDQFEQTLWRPIIKNVFVDAPRSMRKRSALAPRIHEAKELRNRVFHHEPIWYWQDLLEQHQRMCETMSWISEPLADLLTAHDRFAEVWEWDLASLDPLLARLET